MTTLQACGGSTAGAAQMLGVSVRKIQYKLHECGMSLPRALAQARDAASGLPQARRQAVLVRSLLAEMSRSAGPRDPAGALLQHLRDEEMRLAGLVPPPPPATGPAGRQPS
jgi:hypothetical protein